MPTSTTTQAVKHIQAILAGKKRFRFMEDWKLLGAPKGLNIDLVIELWRHVAQLDDALDFTEPWDEFERLPSGFQACVVPFFEESRSLRAQLYGAAYEQGGPSGFARVRGAAVRLTDLAYFGVNTFKHELIRRLTRDRPFVDAAIVALHRYRFPEPVHPGEELEIMENRLLWGLISLVAVGGGVGAQEALEAIVMRAQEQLPKQLPCITPRLRAEASAAHVKNALARLSGKRKGKLPPLPDLETSTSSKRAAPPRRPSKPQAMEANLRLAIVDALAEAGTIDLPSLTPKNPYKPSAAIRKKLLQLKLSPKALASLDELIWEGGMAIQHLIWEQWDGEDDYYEVSRLDGIEVLTGLKRLELELGNVEDLSPLAGLQALEHVSVSGQVADLSPLLKLPKLKSVSVSADKTPANKQVITQLRVRKIQVRA